MPAFGGLEPDAIHALIGSGYGTWVETDPTDQRVTDAYGATVVDAPVDHVYEAACDFEGHHRHISLLAPPEVHPLDDSRFVVRLRAQVGLSVIKLSVPLGFRFRADPPHALHMEDYLGGAFNECAFEMRFDALGPERTLLVMRFHGDVRSLGSLTRFFLSRAPELEPAIGGNMVVVAMMAMAKLAGRKETPPDGGPDLSIEDQLASLGSALGRAFLTVGRLGSDGEIAGVWSAARIGATPERLWPFVRDPGKLAPLLSVVESGYRKERPSGAELGLVWKARFGPLRKRYRVKMTTEEETGRRIEGVGVTVDGEPASYGDLLLPDGDGTLYAHRFSTDLKRDWLSRRFLGQHPELERLIAQYPPMMRLIALRRHLGGPRS